MAMVFERIKIEGVAQISYLIGDNAARTAAVIDPQPNVEIYLDLARKHGVRISHVLETHIHADFMSGARSLFARLGDAKLCVSKEGGAKYGFEAEGLEPGQTLHFGSQLLRVRHTPGHTPEHVSFEVLEASNSEKPWGVFSGDSLFVRSVGRPDLLGDEQTDQLERQLYDTIYGYFLGLDDGVLVFPCHGSGSACGPAIGDRPLTTIGVERQTNPFLQHDSPDSFFEALHAGAPPVPTHYPILKRINSQGPPILERPPTIPGLLPHEFFSRIQEGSAQLVDTRQMLAFGGGHIPGAMNIGHRPSLSVWAGTMLDYEKPILLVVEDDQNLDHELWQFAMVGLTRFAGYLVEGMRAWENSSFAMQQLPQVTVHELNESEACRGMQLLDVRSPSEYDQGHLPGAKHCYVGDLREGLDGARQLDPGQPVAVYCGSGYRASIAASILQKRGFDRVCNVPGSVKAWKNAGLELTAVLVGMVGMYVAHQWGRVALQVQPTKFVSVVVGSLLFGIGFGLLAYCPGTNAAALGQGNLDAWTGVLGLLAGSYLFALMSGFLKRTIDQRGQFGKLTIPETVGLSYGTTVLIAVPVIIGILMLVEQVI